MGRGGEGRGGGSRREGKRGPGRRRPGARTRRGSPCPRPLHHNRPRASHPGASEAQPEPRPGWAARTRTPWPRGAGVAGWGSATRGSRDCGWRVWWGGRCAACPFPGPWPRGPAGAAPLATCRPNAPTPSARLTWLESKNKKNYDAGEACEGEKRFHFSPTTASWRDSRGRPQPSSSCHLVPGEERHKGTAASRPGGVSLPARVCRAREGGHYRLQSKRPVLEAKPWSLQWVLRTPWPTSKPPAKTSLMSFTFRALQNPAANSQGHHSQVLATPPKMGHPLLQPHQAAAFGEDEKRAQQDTLVVTQIKI